MPRSKMLDSPLRREYEATLRERYGGMMTLRDIGEETGMSNHYSIKRFVEGLPVINVNGRAKYRTADIAARCFPDVAARFLQ